MQWKFLQIFPTIKELTRFFSFFSLCLKNYYTKETIFAEYVTHNRLKHYLKLFVCFLLK